MVILALMSYFHRNNNIKLLFFFVGGMHYLPESTTSLGCLGKNYEVDGPWACQNTATRWVFIAISLLNLINNSNYFWFVFFFENVFHRARLVGIDPSVKSGDRCTTFAYRGDRRGDFTILSIPSSSHTHSLTQTTTICPL